MTAATEGIVIMACLFAVVYLPFIAHHLDKIASELKRIADNLEGDYKINKIIASLADEYDVPLWNFWRAVQDLPNHGLQGDGAHLTFGVNQFDNPEAMKTAWTIRNLTALQALDAVWQGVTRP